MSGKFDKERDPYTFSLGGISTIASFVAPTAIEIDRMNRIRRERLAGASASASDSDEGIERAIEVADSRSLFGRFWLRLARRMS